MAGLLTNSAFAAGLAGWSLWQGSAVASDGLLTLDGAGIACVGQAIGGLAAGTAWDLDLVALAAAPGSYVGVTFTDAGGRDLLKTAAEATAAGAVLLDGVVAPVGTTGAYVCLWKDSGTDALVVDNLRFTETVLAPAAPAPAAPVVAPTGRELAADGNFAQGLGGWSLWDGHAAAGTGTLLGFNEPDNARQANMSVQQALDLWPQLEATGARLRSPATTDPLGGWMQSFMQGAAERGERVDFVAIHYYADSLDVGRMQWTLERVHALYGKPVWVTEWAPVDWSNLGKYSAGQLAQFCTDASRMMDGLDFAERQSWFSAFEGRGRAERQAQRRAGPGWRADGSGAGARQPGGLTYRTTGASRCSSSCKAAPSAMRSAAAWASGAGRGLPSAAAPSTGACARMRVSPLAGASASSSAESATRARSCAGSQCRRSSSASSTIVARRREPGAMTAANSPLAASQRRSASSTSSAGGAVHSA